MLVAHLNGDGGIGIMYVDLYSANAGKNDSANLARNFRRGQREGLVGSFGIDLEGALTHELFGKVCASHLYDAFHILFTNGGAVNGDNTEHAASRLVHSVNIAPFLKRNYVYRALLAVDFKGTVGAGTAAKLLNELGLEVHFVSALKHYLAVFTKYNFTYHSSLKNI